MQEIEFDIEFSDVTLCMADGNYEKVNKIMLSEFPYNDKWMISSHVVISSSLGNSEMELHFYGDKNVFISEYVPSIGDVYYNPDLRCLSSWCQENGWLCPKPLKQLVRDNILFWKHFWETMIIDSPFLDEMYGKRDF